MRTDPRAELDAVWASFTNDQDPAARDQLIVAYSPLVKYVAGRVSSGLPQCVDLADLVSYGILGLMDAVDKFNPSRGIKFETYAIARIKGAILDELRAMDWVPRSVRARAREFEAAYIALENRLKRMPTDDEIAKEMGITPEELQALLSRMSYTSVLSFDELWSPSADVDDDRKDPLASIADDGADDPVDLLEDAELKEILAQAIERLPEREKTVIALYYYEGLTLKEIGAVLGVTESRVSQMHAKAVLRLRARLHAAQGFLSVG